MVSKSNAGDNLKGLLIKFLSGENPKLPKITVEAKLGDQLQISDNPTYFFSANGLKKQLGKSDSKAFSITLKKWNFTRTNPRKGSKPQIGIEAEDLRVKPLKNESIFVKANRDLLSYKEIQDLLEGRSAGKESVGQKARENKTKKNSNVKKLISPKKPKPSTPKNITSVQKKISKSEAKAKTKGSQKQLRKVQFSQVENSAKKDAESGLKLRRTPFKVEAVEKPAAKNKSKASKNNGKASRPVSTKLENLFDHEESVLSPEELIQAPGFVPLNKKSSVTKTLKIAPANKQKQQSALVKNKEYLSHKQRIKLTEMVSEVTKNHVLVYKDFIDPNLRDNPISIKDILFGVSRGIISWQELTFPIATLNYLPDSLQVDDE